MAKVVAGAVVISFIGASAGILALSNASDNTTTKTKTPELSAASKELVRLLDKRDEITYHAKYQAAAPGTQGLAIETWQLPPRVRQDSEIQSDGQKIKARVLLIDGDRVRCAQLNDAEWSCRAGGEASVDPLESFRQRLSQGTVTARDNTVDGRSVRCFTLKTTEGTSELCLVPATGIPVRISGGQTQMRLVALDTIVDSELFVPPAAVTG